MKAVDNFEWEISSTPNEEYNEWIEKSNYILASQSWANVLETLGASTQYLWNRKIGVGVAIPIFKLGLFRVGYLGFPVSGSPWDELTETRFLSHLEAITSLAGVTMMRATRSFQMNMESMATSGRLSVWIDDLQNYDINQSKKRRKDLAYARRSNPLVSIVDVPVDSAQCYELYAATVLAQSGKLRYTNRYFKKLHELARKTSNIKIFSAINQDEIVRGFVVLILNERQSYYLHGAVDLDGRRHGLSDLLVEHLVQTAQANGALRLDFMASPWEQTGLIKFKEKWGTKTGLVTTFDVSASIVGESVVAYSKYRSRSDRHQALDWRPK